MRRIEIDEQEREPIEPGAAMRPTASPEPEDSPQMRAAQLRRAAKAALKADPRIEATATAEPVVMTDQSSEPLPAATGADQSSEPARLPWQASADDEPQSPEAKRQAIYAKWPIDPQTGQRISPKLLALKQRDRAGDDDGGRVHTGKLAYLNHPATDADYERAKTAFDRAAGHLRTLELEQAGMAGKLQDAIAASDLAAIATLRARGRELPNLIFAAKMGAAQAELTYAEVAAVRAAVDKRAARVDGNNATSRLQELEAEVRAIRNAIIDAETRASDAHIYVGQVRRKLDALKAEALAHAIGPQAHRAPVGVHESGADLSGLAPMPRPSGL